MNKWIKKIMLFPFWMMMGIPEGLDAAADGEAADADQQGNQGEEADYGADTQDDESNLDADQDEEGDADETTDQEADQAAEEEKKKGLVQTPLEERAAQIAEKKVAEALTKERERIESETRARLEAEQKPFVDLSPEQTTRINNDYLAACERREELRELFRLTEDPADKTQYLSELRRTEKWISDTEAWYADNEAKKAEWTKKQESVTALQRDNAERGKRLEATAETFREAKGIPQDAWDESSKWFADQVKIDKLLGAKFADVYRLHGDVAAVEFAFNYCNEHMGKAAQEELDKKEQAKNKLSPGVSAVPQKSGPNPELKKLLAKAQQSGSEEDYLNYVNAARKAGVKR
ncbi:hypothetical protein F6V30_14010 [Oryzomonas sagensis]|uniref:Uncharacterized protein n=1 Tax=Oryzomonas sagensis TaxID=2603857 RepID=A0ABQ6TL04_9BACT|nr:hypothetical protein [Oryzomonas sagensis]KAB0668948.1 hypothetical protein F6V30_14010 [Oryzomonas sagensis]